MCTLAMEACCLDQGCTSKPAPAYKQCHDMAAVPGCPLSARAAGRTWPGSRLQVTPRAWWTSRRRRLRGQLRRVRLSRRRRLQLPHSWPGGPGPLLPPCPAQVRPKVLLNSACAALLWVVSLCCQLHRQRLIAAGCRYTLADLDLCQGATSVIPLQAWQRAGCCS